MNCSVCGQDNQADARFCGQCGNALAAVAEPLHVIEIGVGASFGNGWRQLWKNFLTLFLIVIITVVISAPGTAASRIGQEVGGDAVAVGYLFAFVYGLFMTTPLAYGVSFAFLIAARNERPDVRDMFEAFRNYWNAVLAGLLVGVIVGFGFVLLIVPGIIFACKLAFTPYLVVDRQMGVVEAIQESWRMTRGHAWKVFVIWLLSIPLGIVGLMCCFVGIFPAVMLSKLAFASLYHAVDISGLEPVYEPAGGV